MALRVRGGVIERPKGKLIHALARGRATGERFRDRANPTVFMTDADERSIIDEWSEVEAQVRARTELPLWLREKARTAAQAARRARGGDTELLQRLDAMEARLREVDEAQFGPLRERLRRGAYAPADLSSDLANLHALEVDAFVARLFDVSLVPERTTERAAGMVHYLPSPFAAIRELSEAVGPDDVFVDVGSGLGLVTALVGWLSGARVIGIEIEPAYHARAEALRTALPDLRLSNVCADAREVSYAEATFIYVYDTIRDGLLDELLAKVEFDTRGRPLRMASRGMSTPTFDQVSWLRRISAGRSEVVMYARTGP